MIGMGKYNVVICIACIVVISMIAMLQYNASYFRYNEPISQCCQEYTKECWACQKGETIKEFCALNPGRFGCPTSPPTLQISPKPKCCTQRRKECLACWLEIEVDEFCKINPGKYECDGDIKEIKECCNRLDKECLACIGGTSVDLFCEKYRGVFGCADDIMIGIPLSNKTGIMAFTASVWRKYHNFSEEHIYLFKESSSSQINDDELRKWYGDKVKIKASSKDGNVRRIFDHFSQSSYKILLLADSETVVLKNWKTLIDENIYEATDGFLSLYHSSAMHNYTVDCEHMSGDLCVGNAVGRYGVALTKELVLKLLKNYDVSFESLNWNNILNGRKLRLLYPAKSLSMQIGQTNQLEDNCGENEVAYRFHICEFPDWIKNGIQFYFDRCTNPTEEYLPDKSMGIIEKEGRFWARPAISYCLYGDSKRYNQLTRQNIRRVFSIYPGWKIWIYTDGSTPEKTNNELCEFNVRVIDMSKTTIKSKMSWRFLVASAPVKMYAIRDIDSWLLQRGKEAVDEWIASGKKFHNMRDHPNHSRYPMSGGMWGGVHDAIPNMKELLESRQMDNNYMTDMNFLNSVIWPTAKQSVWTHDSHSLHKFGEDHPFPTKQRGINLFVGNYFMPDFQLD